MAIIACLLLSEASKSSTKYYKKIWGDPVYVCIFVVLFPSFTFSSSSSLVSSKRLKISKSREEVDLSECSLFFSPEFSIVHYHPHNFPLRSLESVWERRGRSNPQPLPPSTHHQITFSYRPTTSSLKSRGVFYFLPAFKGWDGLLDFVFSPPF